MTNTTTTTKTHYETLHVSPAASLQQIKEAYHKAALQLHPDKQLQNGNHETDTTVLFENVKVAWECLRDNRSAYDEGLRLRQLQDQSRRSRAIPITREDCQGPEWIQVDHDDDDCVENHPGEPIQAWILPCRCGEELDIPLDGSSTFVVDCPGCSLTYNVAALFENSNEEGVLS